PRAATDVEDPQRRAREIPPEDLLGARELEPTGAPGEPVRLHDLGLVVLANLRWRLHRPDRTEPAVGPTTGFLGEDGGRAVTSPGRRVSTRQRSERTSRRDRRPGPTGGGDGCRPTKGAEMEPRMNHPAMVVPGAMAALQGLSTAAAGTGVPFATRKMVELRASQINGCSFCVDLHTRELRKAGESEERIATVAAWREAPWFSAAERAALALT